MSKILVFPTTTSPQARREAAERAVQIQRAIGGHIISRPFRGRPQNDPNDHGPGPAAA